LTDQGKRLVDYAKQMFLNHDRFIETLKIDDPLRGVCRFASPGSFGMKMYSFLLTLSVKNPGLIVLYDYAPNKTIINSVLEDRIDIGFVTSRPEDSSLAAEQIDEEELRLIAPPKFKLGSFADLLHLGFINHPDGFHHGSRLLLENFPREFKGMEQFEIKGAINQITRIPEPVCQGLGFTALPDFACNAYKGDKKLQILPLKIRVIDPIYKIYKKHRRLPSRYDYIFKSFESQSFTSKRR
jgi:DNA-binding transcriptional LysR family regulator